MSLKKAYEYLYHRGYLDIVFMESHYLSCNVSYSAESLVHEILGEIDDYPPEEPTRIFGEEQNGFIVFNDYAIMSCDDITPSENEVFWDVTLKDALEVFLLESRRID